MYSGFGAVRLCEAGLRVIFSLQPCQDIPVELSVDIGESATIAEEPGFVDV